MNINQEYLKLEIILWNRIHHFWSYLQQLFSCNFLWIGIIYHGSVGCLEKNCINKHLHSSIQVRTESFCSVYNSYFLSLTSIYIATIWVVSHFPTGIIRRRRRKIIFAACSSCVQRMFNLSLIFLSPSQRKCQRINTINHKNILSLPWNLYERFILFIMIFVCC